MAFIVLDNLKIVAHIHLKHTEARGLSRLLSDLYDKSLCNLIVTNRKSI